MTQIPHNALVVVADGGGATLFRNTGSGGDVTLKEERKLTPKDLSEEGPSGSRPEDQTPRQTDEATFAKQLVQMLQKMNNANKYSDLVLIADPQTLGQMRSAMHKAVEASVVLSMAKDLTNHSLADITKALQ
ncbi:MAG: host attachment family protein [Microvirga sp.]